MTPKAHPEAERRDLRVLVPSWPEVEQVDVRSILGRVAQGQGLELLPGPPGAAMRSPRNAQAVRRRGAEVQRALADALGSPPWIGIGCSVSDRRDLTRSRSEAQEAVTLAPLIEAQPGVVLIEDVLVLSLLASNPAARGRLAAIVEPVYEAEGGGELARTLEALYAGEMSPADVARTLGVHRHTVGNRLRRAEQVLGRSVLSGQGRLLVEVAMAARRLEGPG